MAETGLYPSLGSWIDNRFEVMDIVGTGGTAIVLKCYDDRKRRETALKRFFQDEMTTNLEKRIRSEPMLKINSEYVVKSEEAFIYDGFWHLAMPFVEGRNLREIIDTSRVPEANCIYTVLCLTKGADDMHIIGIVSTDIKPDNTIITPDGKAMLLDLTCHEKIGKRADVSLGTFPYAAPELLNHDVLSAATDIYSIGVVLCEMLVENEEFARMAVAWSSSMSYKIKPDLSCVKKVYPKAWKIIDKAIEPQPENRYSNAGELFNDLMPYYNSLKGHSQKRLALVYSGKMLTIQIGKSVIGRDNIDASNSFISQNHTEIDYDGQNINVRDAGSRNGTFVNGTRISGDWVKLNDGDLLRLANVQLRVRLF